MSVPIAIKHDGPTTGISFMMELPEGPPAKVEVDTGSNSLILDTRFMTRLGIKASDPSVKKAEGKDETGHKYMRYFSKFSGQISPVGASGIAQKDVGVMFQKIIYDGLVGDAFLKSFTVTFDLPHSRMIFAQP